MLKVLSPAWLALMVQVPTPMKLTTEPVIEHTDDADPGMVNTTGRPEEAEANTKYVAPPNTACDGAVEKKVIV